MEIERKYLVNPTLWEEVAKGKGKVIRQGYFTSNENFSVRVRTKGEKAFLTIKGCIDAISRHEFEYEIPVQDAVFMLENYAKPYLHKIRYEIEFEGKIWEVDEFQGSLSPLLLAEIELTHPDETFSLPEWVDKEVTEDPSYLNSNII